MKKETSTPHKFNSISDLHRMLGLPKPLHPMVSLVNNQQISIVEKLPAIFTLNFYKISFIENLKGKMKYGQNYYDFDEGSMVFTSPNQLVTAPDDTEEYDGFNLFVHPDFLQTYSLANKIKKFGFFSYATNEALHLSDEEKTTITSVFKIIGNELKSRIDDFSQDVVVSQIELLLNYSNRFYKRQFTTRKTASVNLLEKLEKLLDDYFDTDVALRKGLPTVQYLAEQLNASPHYLSNMLRSLTGQNAQQHIHNRLIEKAKEILAISDLSVAEIAYQLGFEYPQSFSKLFKRKTNLSPLEFRQSFN